MRKLEIAAIVATVLMLAGSYFVVRDFAAADTASAVGDRSYRLTIGARIQEIESRILKAREGDHVELLVTSALPAELYVHGLEIDTVLVPGKETPVAFTAEHSGRFYVHLHHVVCSQNQGTDESHLEVAVIEVEP
jgi:hypothetical protein